MSRTTTVPSFKSFQSGRSSFHRAYTHIVTKRSQYRRRRTTSSAPIKRTLLYYILLSLCTRIELKSLVKRLCFAVDLFVVRYKSTGTVVSTHITSTLLKLLGLRTRTCTFNIELRSVLCHHCRVSSTANIHSQFKGFVSVIHILSFANQLFILYNCCPVSNHIYKYRQFCHLTHGLRSLHFLR